MNKEIQNKIDTLEANHKRDLAELRAELTKPVKGWSPNRDGNFIASIKDGSYIKQKEHGVVHTDTLEAIKHEKSQKLQNWLYQLALELNEGWEPDWHNTAGKKFFFKYLHMQNTYHIDFDCTEDIMGVSYFKSEAIANKAIEIIKTWELES